MTEKKDKKGKTDHSRIVVWIQENLEDEITTFYVFPTRYALMSIMSSVIDLVEEVRAQSKYRITDESIMAVYMDISNVLCDALRAVDRTVCVNTLTDAFLTKERGIEVNWKKVYIDATRRFRIEE